METSEEIVDRKTKNSMAFSKSLYVDPNLVKQEHLKHVSESIFKGTDK